MKLKNIFIGILLFLLLLFFSNRQESNAQKSATASIKPANTSTASSEMLDKLKQIEILKDKIATKVAEIRQKDKAAFFGKVKTVSDENIILISGNREINISHSEDTIAYSFPEGVRTEIAVSKIKQEICDE